ncbi:MAG: DUF86 domain-containing protein [Culturomica sp.]|jgi:uncharacterized protein with HEPN domain|nr:DUF86 domain-containing protein [Culturomica sp.]
MERHDIPKCLVDIRTSINSIESYLTEQMGELRDFNLYKQKKSLRRSVERELEIIGEATNRILKTSPAFEISNARKIIDLRNWVIHAYDNVNDTVIWGIVTNHLPLLKAEVDRLLGEQ